MKSFYMEVWNETPNKRCRSCGAYLSLQDGYPSTGYFDHLLEKSTYPQFAYNKENIYLCCLNCHANKTNGFPSESHKKAIEEFKEKYL